MGTKSYADVNAYYADQPEPARSTLLDVRRRVLALQPEAVEVMAYGIPTFKLGGKAYAGLGGYREFCSWFPHSGSTLDAAGDLVDGYGRTKSALHFPLDQPLPQEVVEGLVALRLAEIQGTRRG